MSSGIGAGSRTPAYGFGDHRASVTLHRYWSWR
mgnify:FL=1